MRPLATWLVVGGLAVLGLFAARDALRSDTAPASSAGPTSSLEKRRHALPVIATPPQLGDKDRLAAEIQALGAGGILYVTDATCHRYLLGLPALVWTTAQTPPGTDCLSRAPPVVNELSGLTAKQVGAETIEVSSEIWSHRFPGISPAFKPGGTLTFVRDGRLFDWTTACPAGTATVTFRGLRAIDRCPRPILGAPRLMQEVVWTGEDDFAAIAGPPGAMSLLVTRNGQEVSLFHSVGASLGGLVASPHGRYFGARVGGSMFVFDSRRPGNLAPPAGAERATAVTWSPDDRFTALASESFVYLYPSAKPRRALALPLSAIQLDWR
jgi:hypothetical protein